MRLRLWAAIVIFAGSYFPLSLILLAQDYDFGYLSKPLCKEIFASPANCVIPFANPKLSISIFLICLVSLIITLLVFRSTKTKRRINIIKVKYVPAELMNYTLPYVVSFMGVSYAEQSKFIGMIIFLCWIFWITYKSGQLIMNPILVAFGWRLYEVTFRFDGESVEHDGMVLANSEIIAGDLVRYGSIQDVIIVRK
jgi:hypothetical protein